MAGSGANVIAFYDVCRSDLRSFPNLTRGDETVIGDMDGDDYNYMHICTKPLSTVPAKSTMAESVLSHLTQRASENADSLVQIPTCWAGLRGVEKTDTGDVYHLKWVDRKRSIAGRKEGSPAKRVDLARKT